MLKLVTKEELENIERNQPSADLAGILGQISVWAESLDDDWYDEIIYQTLDRVVDIIFDAIEE